VLNMAKTHSENCYKMIIVEIQRMSSSLGSYKWMCGAVSFMVLKSKHNENHYDFFSFVF